MFDDYKRRMPLCPRCGEGTVKTTLIGFMDGARDPNRASCYNEGCGWSGSAEDTKIPAQLPLFSLT